MAYTREEIMAELARRKQPQGYTTSQMRKLNEQNAPNLANARIKTIFSGDKPGALEENIAGFVHGGNKGFSKTFGFGKHVEDMKEAYERSKELNPLATELGNIGAQVYSDIPFYMTGSAAGNFLSPKNKYLANLVGAGLGGAVFGAAQTPEDDESRLSNALMGGLANAAIPGLVVPGARAIKNLPFSKNKIAQGISGKYGALKNQYNKLYENVLGGAKESTKFGSKNINKQLAGVGKDAKSAVRKAIKTGDAKDIHKAKSQLGKFINSENRVRKAGGSVDLEGLENAHKLKKRMEGGIKRTLGENYKEYSKVAEGYKRDIIPYQRNPAIRELMAGDITTQDFVKALRGGGRSGKLFRAHLAKMHPEIRQNQLLEMGLKGTGALGGAYYGAPKLWNWLNPSRRQEK